MALLCLILLSYLGVQAQTPRFKVIAFYNGTWDAAHINFVQEANQWFPQMAAQYNFSYESTTNWNNLNATFLSQYQVVLFLDDAPTNATQRAAFQTYMQNGGAWMGFHVCAFTTNANAWSWYNNTFLGSGNFQSNTWGPTTAVLRCENQNHPSTQQLPTTFTSAVSEWYAWSNDLRNNSNISILCSIDPSSFPLGTDPNQSWYSGYYPVIWTNKNYKMLYANFGHNDMNYATNTGKSSTFASATQNKFIIDGLLWLGGVPTGPTPAIPIPGTVQAENYTSMSGIQTETTTDTGGGLNVGYTDAGDWLDYKVNVQTAGTYNIQYRVAAQTTAGSIQLKNGNTVLATTTLPVTGAWQTWTTVNTTATLAAGEQTLRLQVVTGGFNLNWISFASANPVAPVGSVITLRGNNNLYVSGENGTQAMRCTRTAPQTWEQFSVLSATGGKIALRSMGKYVSSENGATAITCNRTAAGATELFDWIQNSDGTISLRGNNGFYVSSENGAADMTCTRTTIGGWEKFNFSIVGPVVGSSTVATGRKMEEVASDEKALGIAAFPNPFQQEIYYSLPANVTSHVATLYDINGRAQARVSFKSQQSRYKIDAAKLPPGFYVLNISANNYKKQFKLQKSLQ
ncbi:putative secreted protein (Por secretion system target) [Chitinophaga skermanii]|uniref:Putative secreted protein (Por secretion system target) n=1 Tax=Chitinophaga skermanii TaxID=331697 RepID=A0A327QY49_9BACT|nr:carbohydrate-binding protein [Chitinophaga skermanii]RAJ08654.1 putative secreted protein (Por secretion system target) [Chitinophaga skermanii]